MTHLVYYLCMKRLVVNLLVIPALYDQLIGLDTQIKLTKLK